MKISLKTEGPFSLASILSLPSMVMQVFKMCKERLTKGSLNFLLPFGGARSCSMGWSLLVSIVQNSSSPLASATPDEDLTAARYRWLDLVRDVI